MTVYGQTIKTETGRRVAAIDTEIAAIQSRIDQALEVRRGLLERFTPDHRNVKAVDERLAELRTAMLVLETQKKALAGKEFARTLPNSNIELLKIIALQNERIIDLLEQLVKRSP